MWGILVRLGLNRLPSSQAGYKSHKKRWKRYEKQQPGHAVQVDVKFITPIGGAWKRFYQFTAVSTTAPDSGSFTSIPAATEKTAIQFLDYLLAKLPFQVDVIQTDNGAEFQSQFHYHVLDRGITTRLHQTRHSQTQLAKWNDPTASTTKSSTGCTTASSSTTAELFNDKLQESGGLLQLQPATRRTRRTDPIRTASDRRPRTRRKPSPLVAQPAVGGFLTL